MQEYDIILEKLFAMNIFHSKLGLERIQDVLSTLGNPHHNLKAIHVAGTNGKGSTASMITAILKEAGYKVGLFTSPFLTDFKESIQVNFEMIKKEEVVSLYNKIKKLDVGMTYFEFKTVMAFLYFVEKDVDFAVIEVGLGGRLDSTNVINPVISIITNIREDHTKILGDSIEKIAFEKAGIIKKNTPVVSMEDGRGLEIIKKIAQEKNALLTIVKKRDINTNLKGEFQKINASLALSAIEALNLKISEETCREGLMNVKIKGRLEFARDNLIFDCAHNPAACIALMEEIKKLCHGKLIVVFSAFSDKDIEHMVNIIEEQANHIIITKISAERAEEPENIATYSKKQHTIEHSPEKALKLALSMAGKEGTVLVMGSCYLVGEVMKVFYG